MHSRHMRCKDCLTQLKPNLNGTESYECQAGCAQNHGQAN